LSGYFSALRAYVASFNDGHLDIGLYGSTQSETNWPGFLTRYGANDEQTVVERADDALVPLGARLLGCDGRSAYQLAQDNVGRFIGRWSLLSQRMRFGSQLFADYGNPYASRPARCRFEIGGRIQDVVLTWQPIDIRDLNLKFRRFMAPPPREIASRTLGDGTRWISLGSFNGDPESAAGRALPTLIASLRADRAALAVAPAIVLDLRRNDGGSSDWPRQIAESLWLRAALDRLPPDTARVDWRVSAANLASIRASRERRIAGGALSPATRRWFDRVTSGLEAALARGDVLWREPLDEQEAAANAAATVSYAGPSRPRGPVYLVTDADCASACLDAVDLWRALGAVHVGQTTSADTLYMDIRVAELPSGLGRFVVPMKVYRGRVRGANEPVVPVHAFTGDIADTPALERWIAGLPERR
jgi:hypothetical protein